jgi:hypothetical protein
MANNIPAMPGRMRPSTNAYDIPSGMDGGA